MMILLRRRLIGPLFRSFSIHRLTILLKRSKNGLDSPLASLQPAPPWRGTPEPDRLLVQFFERTEHNESPRMSPDVNEGYCSA